MHQPSSGEHGRLSGLSKNALSIPEALRPFAVPLLLRGENLDEFERFSGAIIQEIAPTTNMQWLYTFDLIEICWDVLRYRRLKMKVLEMERAQAIETLLCRCEGAGLPDAAREVVAYHAKIIATEWRSDRHAAEEIESRLDQSGFDQFAIEAEAFVQSQPVSAAFQSLIESAERRRTLTLREIFWQREMIPRR
jgi:hypothetical protein